MLQKTKNLKKKPVTLIGNKMLLCLELNKIQIRILRDSFQCGIRSAVFVPLFDVLGHDVSSPLSASHHGVLNRYNNLQFLYYSEIFSILF